MATGAKHRWISWLLLSVSLLLFVRMARTATEAIHRSLPGGAVAAEAMKPYLLRESAGVPISETTASLAMSKVLTVATQSLYIAFASAIAFARLGSSPLAWISLLSALFLTAVTVVGALDRKSTRLNS